MINKIDNIYIINLKKDKDRLKSILKEVKKITDTDPIRIEGVYGKFLSQKELDSNCNYIYSKIGYRSAIGCSMSHIKAWKRMVKNKDKFALFLEDDAVINNNFKALFDNIDIPDDFYIIYLGCTMGCNIDKNYSLTFPIIKSTLGTGITKKVKKINDNVFIPSLPLALHGYLLSNKGAKYLLKNMKKDKINGHIDAQILKYIYNVPTYAIDPQLIKQKDINISSSNNIKNTYPYLLTSLLSQRDENGIPLNYKLTIGSYDIFGYTINSITSFFVGIGVILGILSKKTKIKITETIINISFLIFSLLEFLIIYKNLNQEKFKSFLLNSVVSYCILIISYRITILF